MSRRTSTISTKRAKSGSYRPEFLFRTLKYRNYRLYFGGQCISLIGTWIQMIALSWLVYKLTNSAFMLGLVGFFGSIPTFVLAPFAGVLADRWNKYRLLFITQTGAMIQAILLTILLFTNTIQVWHIIVLSILNGAINAFDQPTRQSFLIQLIEKKEDLSNAIALNSVLVNMARLVGPAIAGVLVAVVGESYCFLINAISYLAILGSLAAMKISGRRARKRKDRLLKELKEGFHYVLGFKPIRSLLLMLALMSLMGMPFQVLMPVFAKDILKGGAHSLGFLMSAAGLGAFAGGIYLASRKSIAGLDKFMAVSGFIFGLGLLAFSFSRMLLWSLIFLTVAGFGMMSQMTSTNTLLQTLADEEKRGRIMSFHTMAFMGTIPFGNLLAGSLAASFGVEFAVSVGGICCVIASLIFYFNLPGFRKLASPVYLQKGLAA